MPVKMLQVKLHRYYNSTIDKSFCTVRYESTKRMARDSLAATHYNGWMLEGWHQNC